MNILFRADSSSTIGTGHIMRDIVLAKQYPNANITFATQELEGNINHKITESGYKIKILKSNDIKELDKLIKKLSIVMIVIDHYGIDYNFEKQLKTQNSSLKILSFDDTYEKHYCDILLNHNISADKKKYKGLVPKHCELRCGSKYTLLRDEFIVEKKKLKQKKQFKIQNCPKEIPLGATLKIFLAMGGADHSNININILKVLKHFLKESDKHKKNIKVNLVTTTANKNLKELQEYCKNKAWIKLHINSNKIAKLMRKSDLAIVTPSVTVNEVYFMRLPFIAIKTADNQMDMYNYLTKKKFLALEEFNKNKLKKNIFKMINVLYER